MGWFVLWICCAIIGYLVGKGKGRDGAGLLLGILLGPLGIIIILVMKPDVKIVEADAVSSGISKKCPFCAEFIKAEAKVCRYCGRDLTEPQPAKVGASSVAESDRPSVESLQAQTVQEADILRIYGEGVLRDWRRDKGLDPETGKAM